jgi:hypothetical protein
VPLCARSNATSAPLLCAGERAALVAEQRAGHQAGRERAAVDHHEGLTGATAPRVERSRSQLLAGPGLTGDEAGQAGRRHAPDRAHQPAHGAIVTEHVDQQRRVMPVDLALGAVVHAQPRATEQQLCAERDPRTLDEHVGRQGAVSGPQVAHPNAGLLVRELEVKSRDGGVGEHQVVGSRGAHGQPILRRFDA